MRRKLALLAFLAGPSVALLGGCGEFTSDGPPEDDANLTTRKDSSATGPSPGADTASDGGTKPAPPFVVFEACTDPNVARALLCEDFLSGAKAPLWTPRPAGLVPKILVRDTPDLLVKGTLTGAKEFYQHDFADRDQSFEAQVKLTVNVAREGQAQVFALFLGSGRSLGFALDGAQLSVFRYDDDATKFKALVPLLTDATGAHVLRLIATAGAGWKFQVGVDDAPLKDIPAPFTDLTAKIPVSVAAGFVGGSASGMVDYSLDNILVR